MQKGPDRRLVWCYRHEPALRIFKNDQSGYLWSVTEHQTGLEYNYNYAEGQSGDLCSVTEHELALSIICWKDKAVTCVVLQSTRWPWVHAKRTKAKKTGVMLSCSRCIVLQVSIHWLHEESMHLPRRLIEWHTPHRYNSRVLRQSRKTDPIGFSGWDGWNLDKKE